MSATSKSPSLDETKKKKKKVENDDDVWGSESSECQVCMDLPCTHTHSVCGQTFCETCLTTVMASATPNCPLCRIQLERNRILPILDGTIILGEDEKKDTKSKKLIVDDDETDGDNDEDDKDPIIMAAIKKSTVSRSLRDSVVTLHEQIPHRKCCIGPAKIIVKGPDAIKRPIRCHLDITVLDFKRCQALRYMLCPEQIRVIHRGAPMDDAKTFNDCKITTGNVIHVIMTMRGS